jgi:hypothetical protein
MTRKRELLITMGFKIWEVKDHTRLRTVYIVVGI